MLGPRLLICDEPVASLDVSITAQIVNLLHDLRRDLKLSLLFIAHDLATVRQVCERIVVLYRGQIMEIAPRTQLYSAARHPYTRALLAAVPVPEPARTQPLAPAVRKVGSLANPGQGCVFRSHCLQAIARCAVETPILRSSGSGLAACHLVEI
jgi:oligopeptide/dipeptide ABC transporter ATP-binding protein